MASTVYHQMTNTTRIHAKTAKLYKKGKSLGEKSCEIKGGSQIMLTIIQFNHAQPLLKFIISIIAAIFHGRHLNFTTFFAQAFGGHTLFIQLGCFCMDFTSFCTPKPIINWL